MHPVYPISGWYIDHIVFQMFSITVYFRCIGGHRALYEPTYLTQTLAVVSMEPSMEHKFSSKL